MIDVALDTNEGSKDGSAWRDGRMQEGNEIVKVDGSDVVD